jgi:hypothetical protein
MTFTNHSKIRNKSKFVSTVIFAAVILASCEKNVDYTRPPDANTVKGDLDSAFRNLTQGADVGWAWKFPNTVFGNNFPELVMFFDKDSTSDVYSIAPRGLRTDLTALRNSGTLSASESSDVLALINSFGNLDDVTLRILLEYPNNSSFKDWLVSYLPNYSNFNGLRYDTREQNVSFNVNSVVQTSLTFQKSAFFPLLKENGIVDFDFRMMKFSRDSISLSSYKNDLENVNTTLYPFKIATVAPFVSASSVMVSANPSRVRVTARLNNTVVPTPAGYNSMLDFFYKAYNQAYSPKYAAYGFVYNGLGSTVLPAALKDAAFIVPTAAYNGTVASAPAGTVLVTLAVKLANGNSQNMEFVKN